LTRPSVASGLIASVNGDTDAVLGAVVRRRGYPCAPGSRGNLVGVVTVVGGGGGDVVAEVEVDVVMVGVVGVGVMAKIGDRGMDMVVQVSGGSGRGGVRTAPHAAGAV
jgi:hypothetical protein